MAGYTVSSSGVDCKSIVERLGWGSSNSRHHKAQPATILDFQNSQMVKTFSYKENNVRSNRTSGQNVS